MEINYGRLLCSAALISEMLTFGAAHAWAQATGNPAAPQTAGNAAADQASAAPAAGEASLADIIVTARKRRETLQSIPASVSAVTAEGLAKAGVVQLGDVSRQNPSVSFVQSGGAQPLISVRGDFNRVGVTEPGTGVFIDGVYITRFTQLGRGPVDVDRVEILLGPQSTLYGKNTIAGAINIVNTLPDLNKVKGYLDGGYGRSSVSENISHIEGAVSVPIINDKLAIRITGDHAERDGYVRDIANGIRGLGYNSDLVRAVLLYEPTSNLTVKLTGSYSYNNAPRADVLLDRPGAIIPFSTAAFSAANPAIFGPQIWDGGSDVKPYSISRSWYGSGEIRLKTPVGDLVSLTNFQGSRTKQISNVDGSQYAIGDQYLLDSDHAFQQELRLQGAGHGFNWLGGVYYLNDRDPGFAQQIDFFPNSANYAAGIAQQRVNIPSYTKTYAAFGQLGYQVTSRLNVLGGLRYASDDRSFPFTFYFLTPGGAQRAGAIIDLPRNKNFHSLTGNVVANYEIAHDVLVYASYSTGNKAGGFSSVGSAAAAAVPFDEESVRAYEVGLKSEFLDRRLRVNIAGFYNDYSNLQVQRSVAINGGQFNLTQNAAIAHVPGVDVNVLAQVTHSLRLNLAYTYQNALIKDYVYAPGVILNNVPVPRSPKNSGLVGATYDTPIGSGKFEFGANLQFKSSFTNDINYTQASNLLLTEPVGGFQLVNLNASYAWGRYSIRAYVNNLLNKQYIVGGAIVAANALFLATPGEPRTGEVSFRVEF